MKYVAVAAFCFFTVLPGSLEAANLTDRVSPEILSSDTGQVLGATDSAQDSNQDVLLRQQIILLLQRIQGLQIMVRVINADPEYTFRDRDNDIRISYAAPEWVEFSENEDERLNTLGMVYEIEINDDEDLRGLFAISDVSDEFILSVFDSGLRSGLDDAMISFEEVLPEEVELEEFTASQNLNDVRLSKYSLDYNGVTAFGFLTGRRTDGNHIFTAMVPFSNMKGMQEEMAVYSEEEAVTFAYTSTRNSEVD